MVFFFFFFAISILERCLEEQNFLPSEDSLLTAALQVCTHKHSDGLRNMLNWQNLIKPCTQIFICSGVCLGKASLMFGCHSANVGQNIVLLCTGKWPLPPIPGFWGHAWTKAPGWVPHPHMDGLQQGGEGKPQASIRVAEGTAEGFGYRLQAKSWACLPSQWARDTVTASFTGDCAPLSVRGY